MTDLETRQAAPRFRERCREKFAEAMAEMPQEQFDELVAGMRKRRRGDWYADKMLGARRAIAVPPGDY